MKTQISTVLAEKLNLFALRCTVDAIADLIAKGVDCDPNRVNAVYSVKLGGKYARVDQRSSGRFMVELSTGNIYGIKGYGQVHKGHFYGTLDTTDDYFWGAYYPVRKSAPVAKQGSSSIPVLTFAPTPA